MSRQLLKRSISVVLCFGIFFTVSSWEGLGTVAAISSNGISAYPSGKASAAKPWFMYVLKPGQTQQDSLTIVNTTPQSQHVVLYPVDAVLANNNGFGMLPQSAPRQDIGSWVQLSTGQLTLPANGSRQISFGITIPALAPPGRHYGGIIVQPDKTTNTSAGTGTSVKIVTRLGVRLYETVSGQAKPRLTIDDLRVSHQGSKVIVSGTMRNRGNTLLSPLGTLIVTNTLGKQVAQQTVGTTSIFKPGDTISFKTITTVPTNLPQRYKVAATVGFAEGYRLTAQTAFWVHPLLIVLFGFLVVSGLGGYGWHWRHEHRRHRRLASRL